LKEEYWMPEQAMTGPETGSGSRRSARAVSWFSPAGPSIHLPVSALD
jgi:hypothetical protein